MIYNPSSSKPQEKQIMVQGYDIPEHPFSDHTLYLKYVNDFPIEKEKDPKFSERNANFLRVLNKYPGQSNIDDIDEIKAELIWMDMELSELHDMDVRSERKSFQLDHLYARSRGRGGFGSRIQVTERHEILQNENKEPEHKGLSLFRHKNKPEPVKVYANQPEPQRGG